jgi:hypothetical protein
LFANEAGRVGLFCTEEHSAGLGGFACEMQRGRRNTSRCLPSPEMRVGGVAETLRAQVTRQVEMPNAEGR